MVKLEPPTETTESRARDRSRIERIAGPLDDTARAKRIFAGDILVHSGLAAMARLREHVDGHVREAFGAADPERAHEALPKNALFESVERARRTLAEDPKSAELFARVLEECGADPSKTF